VFSQGVGDSSPAATERLAPPLPTTGTHLNLPEAILLDGGVFKPVQAKGQVLVIYWWASTCPFCALQSPEMQKLWQIQQAHGLQMLTLSVDKKPADALAYLQKKGYTFPTAWVTPDIHKVLPKPRGLPITVVLGRDGRVLQAEKGQMFAEDVAQLANWL
jgi:thiol-disulfide isomerase/thioredoxin